MDAETNRFFQKTSAGSKKYWLLYYFWLGIGCQNLDAGFSIRIKVGGRNVEVGGEGVTRAAGATF